MLHSSINQLRPSTTGLSMHLAVGILTLTFGLCGCTISPSGTSTSSADRTPAAISSSGSAQAMRQVDNNGYSKPGFFTTVEDGRLWVLKENSKAYEEFLKSGEPAKSVTWLGAGPRGITLRSDSADTLLEYLAWQDGFEVYCIDGMLWVFQSDSEALRDFKVTGEPAKCYSRLGAGPRGVTIRSSDRETVDLYLASL